MHLYARNCSKVIKWDNKYCPPIFTLDLPYMHEYITRSLHSIFNHRKDIVYRRSSSILISVKRISYHKINLYECPFNIQRRLDQGVACLTIHVKVSGSSLGKLFYYAPNFEKVGDILVSACPCVCVCVRVWGIEISS